LGGLLFIEDIIYPVVNVSALGGLLAIEDIIFPVVSVSALTRFIRYIIEIYSS
jgi:hypothetical protein